MRIIPIACESLGTRSMATFVRTSDCNILIDPGVALCPIRYNLPPHQLEYERMDFHWEEIKSYAKKADVLIVTHYHYDHHSPDEPEIYKNKTLFTKHPKKKINKSQKKRARFFLEHLGDLPKKIEFSDGKESFFSNTTIRFSKAVPHGSNTRLGYVTQVCIDDGKDRFIHTSDVQGPCLDEQAQFLIEENPRTIFCDGPMTYMMGFRYSKKSYEASIENIIKVIEETKVKKFAFDHHLLRDIKWQEKIENVYKVAKKKKVKILSFAEFAGKENEILEARRKELHQETVKNQ